MFPGRPNLVDGSPRAESPRVDADDDPSLPRTRSNRGGSADPGMVDLLCREGPIEIERLMAWACGSIASRWNAQSGTGCSPMRILHTDGAATGSRCPRRCSRWCGATIRFGSSNTAAVDLLTRARTRSCGHRRPDSSSPVRAVDRVGGRGGGRAGAGRLYRETTNPRPRRESRWRWRTSRGGGRGREFVQFHRRRSSQGRFGRCSARRSGAKGHRRSTRPQCDGRRASPR